MKLDFKLTDEQKEQLKKGRKKRFIYLDCVLVVLIGLLVVTIGTPGKVKGLKVTGSTYDSVSLSWQEAENADGYHIYRSRDGKDFDFIGTTDETEYTDSDLITGRNYTYRVSAYKGIQRNSLEKDEVVAAKPELAKPKLKGSVKTGVVKLSFDPVDGAIGYEILRDGKKIGDQKETHFIDADAESDKQYKYQVRAYRYKTKPVYSKNSNKVNLRLVAVGKMDAEIEGEDIIFTWGGNPEYVTYEIYNGNDLLTTTDTTRFVLEGFDPEKQYDMKLVGISEDESKKSPANEQVFEIESTPMTNEEARDAACDWGVMIADDNSFQYGTGKRAHRTGCYFCGTNVGPVKNIKGTSLVNGHSYEKTYCCNPFVHACYAHGAGDPAMLKSCQNGGSVGMSAKSYTRFGNWKKVGKPAKSNLQRGDVLVRSGHVSMYIGNGQIVQAIDKGWTDESIKYNNLSDKSYGKYSFVMRYTGTGRGVKYDIHEVDKSELKDADSTDKAEGDADKPEGSTDV